MPSKRCEVKRLPAAVLVAVLSGSTTSWAAEPGDEPPELPRDVDALSTDGGQRYRAGDYVGAADAFTRALNMLPENQENRSRRANLLMLVLEAHEQAYRVVDETGRKDIAHLRRASTTADDYLASFREEYDEQVQVDAAILDRVDELRRLLEHAERDSRNGPCLAPPVGPCLSPPSAPAAPLRLRDGLAGRDWRAPRPCGARDPAPSGCGGEVRRRVACRCSRAPRGARA